MAKPLLSDELWEIIEPLLPQWSPSPKGSQPRLDDRKALTGILFVLKTGIPWEDLPQELGCGSGMTCWRRLRDWKADGTWDEVHKVLLGKLRAAGKLDLSLGVIDSSSVRTALGGPADRPQPGRSGQAGDQAPHHRRGGRASRWLRASPERMCPTSSRWLVCSIRCRRSGERWATR